MEFYSPSMQPVLGPVVMLPQKGSVSGGSKRPMNSYAILRGHGSILVDAPFSWTLDAIEGLIETGHGPVALVLSHRDLAGSGDAFAEIEEHYEIPLLIHPLDAIEKAPSQLTVPLHDPTSRFGTRMLREAGVELIHIPGHSPGSIMLYLPDEGGIVLAGDSAVGPGPEQDDRTPRLQRPVGADEDDRFLPAWQAFVESRPLAAVLPLHGEWYLRRDLGDAAFDAVVANIWEGEPMDPSET